MLDEAFNELSVTDWSTLPEVILGNIFQHLPTVDRLYVGKVCSAWENAAQRPEVWQCFDFSEKDVDDFGNSLDYLRHELFFGNLDGNIGEGIINTYISIIKAFGKSFRQVNLIFKGRNSNRILYTLSDCCFNITCLRVQRLHQNVQVVRNHDSSYRQAVYNILQRNTRLEELEVRDIDNYAVSQQKGLLPFGATHSYTLKRLTIVQSFQSCNLGNFMYLVNLRELAIEPQFLSYSLLHHLAGQSLTDLHVLAVSKHMEFYNEALQNWQWREIKKQGPNLRVHCLFRVSHEWTEKDIILKKDMPVKALKYAKYHLLNYPVLTNFVCNYATTLVDFIDFSPFLKSYELAQGNRSDRPQINGCILQLVTSCPSLRTLAVKEVLYSQNILTMLSINKYLDIFLREDQIEYSEFNVDFHHPVSYEEYDMISRSWVDIDTFRLAAFQLTNKQWHFFQEGSESYDRFLKKHFRFL